MDQKSVDSTQIPPICFEAIGRLYLQVLSYEDSIVQNNSTVANLQSQIKRLEDTINHTKFHPVDNAKEPVVKGNDSLVKNTNSVEDFL